MERPGRPDSTDTTSARAEAGRPLVLTIGHSSRTLAEFIELLRAHGVSRVADVRTVPRSRRNPHFGGESLDAALRAEHIDYVHLPELGGLRRPAPDSPHTALAEPAIRAYADHMRTPEFAAGLVRLIALARAVPTALMCAEAKPEDCHRSLLSDALIVHGAAVEHVVGPGARRAHVLSPLARLADGALLYVGPQESLPGL